MHTGRQARMEHDHRTVNHTGPRDRSHTFRTLMFFQLRAVMLVLEAMALPAIECYVGTLGTGVTPCGSGTVFVMLTSLCCWPIAATGHPDPS